MPEMESRSRVKAPYLALLFNLGLALTMLWLTLSNQDWSESHRASSPPPTLVIPNGLIPVMLARWSTPERILQTAQRYGVQMSEDEWKLLVVASIGSVRLLSLVFVIDSVVYTSLIFVLESNAPWLFSQNFPRVLLTAPIWFALVLTSSVASAYYYRRRHPELHDFQQRLKQRVKHGH